MFWCMFGGFPFNFLKAVKVSSPLHRGSLHGCMYVCVQKIKISSFFKKVGFFYIIHLILHSKTSMKFPFILKAAGFLTLSVFHILRVKPG